MLSFASRHSARRAAAAASRTGSASSGSVSTPGSAASAAVGASRQEAASLLLQRHNAQHAASMRRNYGLWAAQEQQLRRGAGQAVWQRQAASDVAAARLAAQGESRRRMGIFSKLSEEWEAAKRENEKMEAEGAGKAAPEAEAAEETADAGKEAAEEAAEAAAAAKAAAKAAAEQTRAAAEEVRAAAKKAAADAKAEAEAAAQQAAADAKEGKKAKPKAASGGGFFSKFSKQSMTEKAQAAAAAAKAAAGKAQEAAAKAKTAADSAKGKAKEKMEGSEYYQDASKKFGKASEKVNEKYEQASEKMNEKVQEEAKKHSQLAKIITSTKDIMRGVFGAKPKRKAIRRSQGAASSGAGAGAGAGAGEGGAAGAAAGGEDEEKIVPNTETTDLVLMERQKSKWERVTEKLRQAPLISSLVDVVEDVAKSETVQTAKNAVNDKVEDVRESWETSQNPWVYRTSAVLDSVMSENEWGTTIREVKRLDSNFHLEVFLEDMHEEIAPSVIKAFLMGDREELGFWCTDDAMARINAALTQREELKLVLDPSILDLTVDIMSARPVEKGPPVIVCSVMAQHINCIRNDLGEIVEGSDSEIRAVFYIFAMQRVWHEERGELAWEVAELMVAGNQLYL